MGWVIWIWKPSGELMITCKKRRLCHQAVIIAWLYWSLYTIPNRAFSKGSYNINHEGIVQLFPFKLIADFTCGYEFVGVFHLGVGVFHLGCWYPTGNGHQVFKKCEVNSPNKTILIVQHVYNTIKCDLIAVYPFLFGTIYSLLSHFFFFMIVWYTRCLSKDSYMSVHVHARILPRGGVVYTPQCIASNVGILYK